ncbi:MAG: carboxylating nicotinate-nucleotide diphosphorylase [Candidatus Omnitrophica bacterium]|nr:carboxylating nicotinate-nucleotide diphosphorylase [Candidatus Omnitrophota bacterium]MDD5429274.1 carboxylating nicotinate-nucleotide diphosphorylase [Candidatus Omnitrophota bacterium]
MKVIISNEIKKIVARALQEDIGRRDTTSTIALPPSSKGRAVILARQSGILCGLEVAKEAFLQIDTSLVFKPLKKDGDSFCKNEGIARISGNLCSILAAERVALNFLALLSGVSTSTKKMIVKAKNTRVKIMDTRKTTPGLRVLEKYAVTVGGGRNHRSSLFSGIIIKDNHLRASGCIAGDKLCEEKVEELIKRFRSMSSLPIEIEVENLREFKGIIKYEPDIILLDNFPLSSLRAAVDIRNKKFPEVLLEASGGVNFENVSAIACSGVDFISAGMLTHSPPAVDFSLEMIRVK